MYAWWYESWVRAWVWMPAKALTFRGPFRRWVCDLRGHRWFITGTACCTHGVTDETDRYCLRCVRHEVLVDCCD